MNRADFCACAANTSRSPGLPAQLDPAGRLGVIAGRGPPEPAVVAEPEPTPAVVAAPTKPAEKRSAGTVRMQRLDEDEARTSDVGG